MSASQPGAAFSADDDVRLIRTCLSQRSQDAWAQFFERFEDTFRRSIARTLRDGTVEDRDDAYQELVKRLLEGKVLPHIDLTAKSGPVAYLMKTAENVARHQHQRKARLAEEPLEDDESVSSHFSRLADKAAPVPANELLRRLAQGLKEIGIGAEKQRAFEALCESENMKEVIEKTGLGRATAYRYVKELDRLAHTVLGVPYEEEKNFADTETKGPRAE